MLGKQLWLNLALLCVVAALLIIAYLEPGLEHPVSDPTLTSLSATEINQIILTSATSTPVKLQREQDGWIIVEPIRVNANESRVDGILKLLQAKSFAKYPVAHQTLSNYGLDKPKASLKYNDLEIEFGDTEALNNRRYVRVGDNIHLIGDHYYYQSQLLLTALIDTALLPNNAVLDSIQLPGINLFRKKNGWELRENQTPAMALDAMMSIVDEWRYARAIQIDRYHNNDVAVGQVSLSLENGSQINFDIVSESPDLILGRKDLGISYHFAPQQAVRMLGFPQPVDHSDRQMINADAVAQ